MADGHALRRMDFEKFEQQFKECISSAAIQTKFEQHHKQGTVVVAELEKILETEEQQLLENRWGGRYIHAGTHAHIHTDHSAFSASY